MSETAADVFIGARHYQGLLEPPDTMALADLGKLSAPSSNMMHSTFSAVSS